MEEVLTTVPVVPTMPVVPTVPVVTSVTVEEPSVPVVPVVPLMPLQPPSDMLLNEVKPQTNPWTVSDFDVFLFYCCPQCEHKTRSKTHFLDHAFLSHPEAQETIKSMQNRQVFHIQLFKKVFFTW